MTKKKKNEKSATSEPRPAKFSFLVNGRFYHSGSHIMFIVNDNKEWRPGSQYG